MGFHRGFVTGRLAVYLLAAPAFATGITYTCDPSLSSAVCNTLNTTIAGLYSSTFTNANASIYIQPGPVGLASSLQFYTNIDYTDYADKLIASESDADDITAVASLGGDKTNPVNGSDGVAITSALAAILGLANAADSLGTTTAGSFCTSPGAGACYNGVITYSNLANTFYFRSGDQLNGTYDFYTAVEHETDEILGTSSCIVGIDGTQETSVNCLNGFGNNPPVGVSAADLFRYTTARARSYLNSANGSPAWFSIDGGTTAIANYHNSPDGPDYGDWDSAALRVQNAFGTMSVNGIDITNDGGSEIRVLDAVGYTVVVAPEPGTAGLAAFSFLGAGWLKRRSSRKKSAKCAGSEDRSRIASASRRGHWCPQAGIQFRLFLRDKK